MAAILWIAYLAMGFVQAFAIFEGIECLFDLHIIISSFIAIICSQIPFIGAAAGIIGATYGWGWEWRQSIVLFMWQPIIFLFITFFFRTTYFFQNNERHSRYSNDDKEEVNSNIFLRMFRGELSLPVSYWVFGVLGSFIWNFIFHFMLGLFEEEHQLAVYFIESYGMIGYKVLFSFIFISCLFYFAAVYVGQWRCAERYKGGKIWPVLVKITICLGWMAEITLVFAIIKLLRL